MQRFFTLNNMPQLLSTYLSTKDVCSLVESCRLTAAAFNRHEVWVTLAAKNFNRHCPPTIHGKYFYEVLVECQRVLLYAQFCKNPKILNEDDGNAPAAFIRPRRLFSNVDREAKAHAVTAFRDQLKCKNYKLFKNLVNAYLTGVDASVLSSQEEDILVILDKCILPATDVALVNMNDFLNTLNLVESHGGEIDALSECRQFITVMNLLSKCGATKTLQLLLARLNSNENLLKKFLDRFGPQLYVDALYYHRPDIAALLIPSLSAHAASDHAPATYGVACHKLHDVEFGENALYPLEAAVDMLDKLLKLIQHTNDATKSFHVELQDVIVMTQRLLASHANPDQTLSARNLGLGFGVMLGQTVRSKAQELLEELRTDHRLDDNIKNKFEEILSSVATARPPVFTEGLEAIYTEDNFSDLGDSDGSRNGSPFGSPSKESPTKKFKGLSLGE